MVVSALRTIEGRDIEIVGFIYDDLGHRVKAVELAGKGVLEFPTQHAVKGKFAYGGYKFVCNDQNRMIALLTDICLTEAAQSKITIAQQMFLTKAAFKTFLYHSVPLWSRVQAQDILTGFELVRPRFDPNYAQFMETMLKEPELLKMVLKNDEYSGPPSLKDYLDYLVPMQVDSSDYTLNFDLESMISRCKNSIRKKNSKSLELILDYHFTRKYTPYN